MAKSRSNWKFFLLVCVVMYIASCGRTQPPESVAAQPAQPVFDEEAWRLEVFESWAEQDGEFKNSLTSPLAGVSRYELDKTETIYFFENDEKLEWTLESKDEAKFSIVKEEDSWKWVALSEDVSGSRDGEDLPSDSFFSNGDILTAGRFTSEFYPIDNQIVVLVFDAEAQEVKDFKTIERFEPNAKFAVTAKIVKYDTPEQVELMTARQRVKKQFKYATLKFVIDGVDLELTAYKYSLDGEYSDFLFMPFTDKTTGKHTYGGGRYLGVEEPKTGDAVQIDFNLVTNPLCSYTPIYNCIVPPRENKLPIEILAGEKKFH